MDWLATIPTAVVRAHVAMLGPLAAEQSLLEVSQIGVGTGSYKQHDARRILNVWQRARDGKAKAARFPSGLASLPSMGIGFRKRSEQVAK